jgi:ATP-dependent DNA helicase PIF1
MTVNKAQGQTIPNAGIYLPEPVFSHGQLYVALSRSTARKNVKILVITDVDNKKTNSDESKKEEASCQYLHEEHSLEGDPYILGEILCACTSLCYLLKFVQISSIMVIISSINLLIYIWLPGMFYKVCLNCSTWVLLSHYLFSV